MTSCGLGTLKARNWKFTSGAEYALNEMELLGDIILNQNGGKILQRVRLCVNLTTISGPSGVIRKNANKQNQPAFH